MLTKMIPKETVTTRIEVMDDAHRAWSGWMGESSAASVSRDGVMDVVVSGMEAL